MADDDSPQRDPQNQDVHEPAGRGRRRGPDPITLTAGLLTVSFAVYIALGGAWNLQLLLAIGAVGVGVIMLAASLRSRHR